MKDKEIVVIVFGGSTNAIGQIRSAYKAGYKCINIVEPGMHSWSRKSRYCQGLLAPHPYNERDKCLKFVLQIIRDLDSKPYLFFASDDWMDMVGENESLFREIAIIPQSPWDNMVNLYNKKYLYRIAEERGIPYPKTIEVETLKDIVKYVDFVQSPYIVKPQTTVSQNEISKCGITAYHRTQKFEDKNSLLEWVNVLLSNNVDFPVLIQEFIPGDATTLYTLTSYSNAKGELVAGSVGHKLRQFPPVAGRITAGVLSHDNALYELGRKFLKDVNFHGLANTEFKYDSRDGKYKLMEINTRLGAWNYSALYAGLNLVDVAIKDMKGESYDGMRHTEKKDGYIWYNLAIDLSSAIYMNGKIGEHKYKMSLIQWYKSIKHNSFEAVWDIKDIKPFFYNFYYLIKKVISQK